LHKCADGKKKRKNEEQHASPAQSRLIFGKINEHGAAAAEVKEEDMQSLEIENFRVYEMMEKSKGQGRCHNDPEERFQ
jgi:hypothetical protein